jgi:hypothetical protein
MVLNLIWIFMSKNVRKEVGSKFKGGKNFNCNYLISICI